MFFELAFLIYMPGILLGLAYWASALDFDKACKIRYQIYVTLLWPIALTVGTIKLIIHLLTAENKNHSKG